MRRPRAGLARAGIFRGVQPVSAGSCSRNRLQQERRPREDVGENHAMGHWRCQAGFFLENRDSVGAVEEGRPSRGRRPAQAVFSRESGQGSASDLEASGPTDGASAGRGRSKAANMGRGCIASFRAFAERWCGRAGARTRTPLREGKIVPNSGLFAAASVHIYRGRFVVWTITFALARNGGLRRRPSSIYTFPWTGLGSGSAFRRFFPRLSGFCFRRVSGAPPMTSCWRLPIRHVRQGVVREVVLPPAPRDGARARQSSHPGGDAADSSHTLSLSSRSLWKYLL